MEIQYRPHRQQALVHASDARFRVCVAGRQSGKTLTGVAEISSWAFEQTGGKQFWWVTQSYQTKDKAWRDLLAHIPRGVIQKANATERYIQLANGSRISIRSADAKDSLVSESLHGIICDEFAQWDPDVWPQYLRPTIGTTEGRVLFLGSPRGRNWAYDLYMNGLSGSDPDWASFRWSSDQSPYFDKSEFEKARRELPERIFRQEYLAEFVEGGGEVFRGVDGCVGELATPDQFNVIGMDIAKLRDFTVFVGLNSRRETFLFDRFNQLDYNLVAVRAREYARRYRARLVLDSTGAGEVFYDMLTGLGVDVEPFKFTSDTKRNLVENLMLSFEQRTIRIPKDPTLLEELKSFTFETMPSGRERFNAPEGRHDDTVIALGLAAWGQRGLPMGFGSQQTGYGPTSTTYYHQFKNTGVNT